MRKCEFLVNLHTPCSNEGHQGEGDGEDNPEHVFVVRETSNKLKQKFLESPGAFSNTQQ